MATGTQQERYRALFPQWFFKKKYIEINNKALGRILILKLYLSCFENFKISNFKMVTSFVFESI